MIIAVGGTRGSGGHVTKCNKKIMEHWVVQNLKAVSGDARVSQQRHHKLAAALGSMRGNYDEIVYKLVREIDLGKELGKIITALSTEMGCRRHRESSGAF